MKGLSYSQNIKMNFLSLIASCKLEGVYKTFSLWWTIQVHEMKENTVEGVWNTSVINIMNKVEMYTLTKAVKLNHLIKA